MADLPVHDTRDIHIVNPTDSTKKVTTTTDPIDSSKERLDIDLGDTFSFQLQPFTPIFDFDVSGISLNTSTDTSLKLITTTTGKIDFIAIAGSNATFEVVLKIDGVEVLRIKMSELGSDIGLANATNVILWVETANKNFRYSPKQGVDFTTGFEVLAKAVTGTPTVNWLVNHREAG